MERKKKEQRFTKTSRKEDHMPWPPRCLEPSRMSIHLALTAKASRMCPCALLLTYLQDYRFCYLLYNPFETYLFFLEVPKHYYKGDL